MELNDESKYKCPICNRRSYKLVPMYDNDNEHKNLQLCKDCKKKLKTGKPIIKL